MIHILSIIRTVDVHVRNWIARKRLKVDEFTIITNTCIGGVIYNKLGKRFMSPTINLGFCDKDMIKFVNNLDHYLSCPLRFVDESWCPVAYLDDIKLEFVHYKTREDAECKWNERVLRVNRGGIT